MEQNIDNNKIFERNEETVSLDFKYNFINLPWDDRSNKSKCGIVVLLVAIFVATMAGVIYNFIMHYRGFEMDANNRLNNNETNCLRVKLEDYPYVARIHAMSSKELLCVGAVVSTSSVIANGVCIKAGPIRMYLGSPSIPHCKKGFAVDLIETVFHEGIISKKLALLSSYGNIAKCSSPIKIGGDLGWSSMAEVIGRPLLFGRSLPRQYVSLMTKEIEPKSLNIKNMKRDSMVCVKTFGRCPIKAGDLLVQSGYLFGIASTSVHRTAKNNLACFADLMMVRKELKELDVDILLK